MSATRKVEHLIREFKSFVDTLNDPRLDACAVEAHVRNYMSLVMWTKVAGLCDDCAMKLFEEVVYSNLWVTPASLASRREAGQLDSLFGGA